MPLTLAHRACDTCRLRKVQCSTTNTSTPCSRCARIGMRCVYTPRPAPSETKRRLKRPLVDVGTMTEEADVEGFDFGELFATDEDGMGGYGGGFTPPPPGKIPSLPASSATSPADTCTCLVTLYTALTLLRTPAPTPPQPLRVTLSIIRTTLSTLRTTLACSCHTTPQGMYVCVMLLGTVVPLLLLRFEGVIHDEEAEDGGEVELAGVKVELGREAWKGVRRAALDSEWQGFLGFLEKMREGVGGRGDAGGLCRSLTEMVRKTAGRVGLGCEGVGS